ncbi:hypothetical protein B5X24_HaOG205328 [Helicoverpa armigera]|uniref:EF-hand domain-containing protein n=1 Tax=Helicoverpa armigera TaxID=29058 RepID=A0A2W1BQR1_HELAM|nr:hypothetical protein B5X24_HaOG205328 [Helicoverpa armigera]
MEEEEPATLTDQFDKFAKLFDNDRDGTTIDLYRSDYWLRQSNVLEDRALTMTDTGIAWMKFSKTELTYDEWYQILADFCTSRGLDRASVEAALTNCGLPGSVNVNVPQYRDLFDTVKPPPKLLY